MAESTFNPEVWLGAVSGDGKVVHSDDPISWANLIAGAGNAADNFSFITPTFIFSSATTDMWHRIRRGIFTFDTSSIPDDATIVTAVFSLYGRTSDPKSDNLNILPDVNIYSASPASNNNLVGGDFNSLGKIPYCDTLIAYADWVVGWNDFVLNPTGRAAISLTGVTKIGTRNVNYDVDEVEPAWSSNLGSYLQCDGSENTNPPKLVVNYSIGGAVVSTQECRDTIAEKTTGHGTLESKGASEVTQHGHVWATSPNPTTADSKTENGAKPNLGQFQSAITGILPDTTYYVRAYATNTEDTVYGTNVTIGSGSTIGRRDWWVERDEFHFISEWGVEQKVKGTSIANDQDILAHLGL